MNDDNMEESPPINVEKNDKTNSREFKLDSLIRDPGLRPSIVEYPSNQHDEIIREYIRLGPYQIHRSNYPLSASGSKGNRSFQAAWFGRFWWLEYSLEKDAAYCFPCYLFNKKPIGRAGSDRFTTKGFNKWKKINCGKDCAFFKHEGTSPASAHNFSVKCYEDFRNPVCHIENVIEKQTAQEIKDNRLRVKTSVEIIKWLTMQACALRGHDERPSSINRGNFLELLKFISSYNKEVENVVLDNAPQNAQYTLPDVQKEILHIFARNVQQSIRDEIGNAKFCLIIDESRDESKKEQMAIVVRFVDRDGHLQLALVAASKEVVEVHKFFKILNFIINVIDSSSKRHDQLQDAQIYEISLLAETGELETGKGVNQIQSLQRPGDTRWSSHYRSIRSLLRLYGSAIVVLRDIAINGSTSSQKGDASFALTHLLSFDFVF
ncbi:uncharacterized protein [Rutidosis leptorrhynchoides]|uniref:uncharacterized protein n=1 Tax=Rutidosis leptorrhynchoides TaxID=125765 RepID=UPI003A991516